MTKNVEILDENGKLIGTTYPKRAKGMLKSGRAEAVEGGAIRLLPKTVPKSKIKIERTEKTMNNNVDINDILNKIDALLEDKAHIAKAYETIEKADQPWKAENAMNVAVSREQTIRQALSFYSDVYDSVKPAGEEEDEADDEEAEE